MTDVFRLFAPIPILLACVLAVGYQSLMAEETAGLPDHPYWERPIPLQGSPPLLLGAEAIADLSPSACGQCHQPQWKAWQDSLHSSSVSPGLLGQLGAFDAATQRDCLTCHAPRQEMLEQWWELGLNSASIRRGVDCASCHVRAHIRHGSRAIAETPHGEVREQPLFLRAEFCAPCHQFDETGLSVNGKPLENTYTEWQQSPYALQGVTCQNCHMAEKQHGFKGIHDLETTRRGLSIQGSRTAQGIRVRVGNTGAGHALPTYITPRIVIRIESLPGTATLEHVIARKMRWSREEGWEELADDRLQPKQWIMLDLALPTEAEGRISVRVEPDYDYHDRVYPTLLTLLADDLNRKQQALLQKAEEKTGRTPYFLYRLTCPEWNGHEEPCQQTD